MINNLTRYFRNALIAKNQGVIEFKNSPKGFCIISKEEFISGVVKKEVFKDAFQKGNKKSLEVIIVAKTIKNSVCDTHNISNTLKDLTGIYYIPAKININGKLEANIDDDKWPWIPREMLEPMVEAQLSVGKLDTVDRFIENNAGKRASITSWKHYVDYAKEFFNYVTKSDFNNDFINIEDNRIEFDSNMYLILDNIILATKEIENLYEDILKYKGTKKLYDRFMTIEKSPTKELFKKIDYGKMIEHKGQMNGKFPLSESQRETMNHFTSTNYGEILAVSGPPGTGKTTLLQSVVANLLVERAINKKKSTNYSCIFNK